MEKVLKPLAAFLQTKDATTEEAVAALFQRDHSPSSVHIDSLLPQLDAIFEEKGLSENQQDKIFSFISGYHGALTQLYSMAPLFETGTVDGHGGDATALLKFAAGAITTAAEAASAAVSVPGIGKIGASIVSCGLKDAAKKKSTQFLGSIRALTEISDMTGMHTNRRPTIAERKETVYKIIAQHAFQLAGHLAEDPRRLDAMNSPDKLKAYFDKTMRSMADFVPHIATINRGAPISSRQDRTAGKRLSKVSEVLHGDVTDRKLQEHDIPATQEELRQMAVDTPIAVASCHLTEGALASRSRVMANGIVRDIIDEGQRAFAAVGIDTHNPTDKSRDHRQAAALSLSYYELGRPDPDSPLPKRTEEKKVARRIITALSGPRSARSQNIPSPTHSKHSRSRRWSLWG